MTLEEVRADIARNRLYVKTSGFTSDAQGEADAERYIAEMRKLKPGFAIISDVSGLKASPQTGTPQIIRLQKASLELGVGRVIRIVGDEIARMQLERVGKETSEYVPEIASSIEEAEQMLDSSG